MDGEKLTATAARFLAASPLNLVAREAALNETVIGMPIYRPPILGVADAEDPFFHELRRPGVVGPHFRLPGDWLPGAASVIAFFLPYGPMVLGGNRRDPEEPSPEWLHARIEGQVFLDALALHLAEACRSAGGEALVPSLHGEFWSREKGMENGDGRGDHPCFTSNWSERHVAHVAGLGTFGLSAGLITREGVAGRFGSVVTTLRLEPDARPYTRHDEYCSHCGACIARCPAGAITASGKDHLPCLLLLDQTRERHHPRYGCGKCQVAVPCEKRIPKRKPERRSATCRPSLPHGRGSS